MMIDCKVEKTKKECNCTYPCSRKGICCECLHYHRSREEFPACFFPDTVERTYDRSVENFIQLYQRKRR